LRYVALMHLGTRPSPKRTSRMPHRSQQAFCAELNGML
jgi:hypothetical protein